MIGTRDEEEEWFEDEPGEQCYQQHATLLVVYPSALARLLEATVGGIRVRRSPVFSLDEELDEASRAFM